MNDKRILYLALLLGLLGTAAYKGWNLFKTWAETKYNEIMESAKGAAERVIKEIELLALKTKRAFDPIVFYEQIAQAFEKEKKLDLILNLYKDKLLLEINGKSVSTLPLETSKMIIDSKAYDATQKELENTDLAGLSSNIDVLKTLKTQDVLNIKTLAEFVNLARIYWTVRLVGGGPISAIKTKLGVVKNWLPVTVQINCYQENIPALYGLVYHFNSFAKTVIQNCGATVVNLEGLLRWKNLEVMFFPEKFIPERL